MKRNISLARNEYERLKLETEDNSVKSTTDGVVTKVRSEGEARDGNNAFIEVSAGGGYYVTGTVNEFDRDDLSVGQSVDVSVFAMDSGDSTDYKGEITEISDRPVRSDENTDMYGGYSYGEGNTNTSYFPFKVKLEKDAGLNENTYAEIAYSADGENGSEIFLPKAFIRTESGDSYVYIKGDKDTLERKSVKTGRELWGEYIQIKNGIEADAVITRIEDEGIGTDTSFNYYVRYTMNGQAVEAKLSNPGFGKGLEVGAQIRIKYLPEKPNIVVRVKED